MTAARTFDGDSVDNAVVAVRDGNNRILLFGTTGSATLPNQYPSVAYQWKADGTGVGAFLTRLSPDGMTVDYTARLVIPSGPANVQVAAQPDASPVLAIGYFNAATALSGTVTQLGNGFDTTSQKQRVLLVGFQPSAESTRFSALLGCDGSLTLSRIRTDSTGRIWIYGTGSCANLPENAYRSPAATDLVNAFLAVVSSDGQTLEKFAFLGGEGEESATDFSFDAQGKPVLVGMTRSAGFPTTPGSFRQVLAGDSDGYVLRMNAALDGVEQSTLLGGNFYDRITGVQVLPSGSIAFTADSQQTGFPTTAGVWLPTPAADFQQGVAGKLSANLSQVEMATYLQPGYVARLAGVDASGRFLIQGNCQFCSGPLFDGAVFQPTSANSSYTREVLLRLRADGSAPDWVTYLPGQPVHVSLSELAPVGATGVVLASYNVAVLPPLPVTVPAAGSPATVNGTVWIANLDFTGTEPCTLQVSPTSVEVPRDGGTYDVNIQTPAGCIWMGAIDSSYEDLEWVEQSSGIGGTVAPIRIPPNKHGQYKRIIHVWVNRTSVEFNQERRGCTDYSLSPTSLSFSAAGGIRTGTFEIADFCNWKWYVPEPYVQTSLPTLTHGERHGTSALGFTISLPENRFAARTATLSIVPEALYDEPANPAPVRTTITQEAGPCTATATPNVVNAPAAGGSFQVALATTGTDCQWQAGVPTPPGTTRFVTLTSLPAGSGNATLTVEVNSTPVNTPRTAELLVAGLRVPIQQAAGECAVTIAQTVVEAPAAGGEVRVEVDAQGSACYWNVVSQASWITLPFGNSSGGNHLIMNVAPNPGQTVREGTVTLLGRTVTVRQAATGNVLVIVVTDPSGIPVIVNGTNYPSPGPLGVQFSMPKGAPLQLKATEEVPVDPVTKRRFARWNQQFTSPTLVTSVPSDRDPAYFSASYDNYYLLSTSTYGQGTVSVSPRPADSFYRNFSTVKLEANPSPGYRLARWRWLSRNENVTSSPWDLVMTAPASVLAEFVPQATSPPVPVYAEPVPASVRFAVGSEPRKYRFALRSDQGVANFGQPTYSCPGIANALFVELSQWSTETGKLSITPNAPWANIAVTGSYTCEARVPRTDQGETLRFPFTFEVLPAGGEPAPQFAAVVNGASFAPVALSTGSIGTIFGVNLADEASSAKRLPLPISLSNVNVRLQMSDGSSPYAELFYVSPTQINFLVPAQLWSTVVAAQLEHFGRRSTSIPLEIVPASPAIFTANSDGKGVPAGTWLRTYSGGRTSGDLFTCPQGGGSCVPKALDWGGANDELYLTLYTTGLASGGAAATQVTVDGVNLPVEYAGPQGQFVGLGQVNVRVPRELRGRGERDLQLTSGGLKANLVKIHF